MNDQNPKEQPDVFDQDIYALGKNNSEGSTNELIRRFENAKAAIPESSNNDDDNSTCCAVAKILTIRGYSPAVEWLIEIAQGNTRSYACSILAMEDLSRLDAALLLRLTRLEGRLYNDDVGGYSMRPLSGVANNAYRAFSLLNEKRYAEQQAEKEALENERRAARIHQAEVKSGEASIRLREQASIWTNRVANGVCPSCGQPLNRFLRWLWRNSYHRHFWCSAQIIRKLTLSRWRYESSLRGRTGFIHSIKFEPDNSITPNKWDVGCGGNWEARTENTVLIKFVEPLEKREAMYILNEEGTELVCDDPTKNMRVIAD